MNAAHTTWAGTVQIVDDDRIMLGVAQRVLTVARFKVETFESSRAFLAAPRPPGPACVVLDLNMEELDGFAVMSWLAKRRDPVPVIILSGQSDIRTSVRTMREGAIDYFCKPPPWEDIVKAVHRGLAIDAARRSRQAEDDALRSLFAQLTSREREVCDMAASGLLNKQIADALGLHERTVKLHRSEGMRKLRVSSMPEMVRLLDRLRGCAPAEDGVHSPYGQSTPEPFSGSVPRGR